MRRPPSMADSDRAIKPIRLERILEIHQLTHTPLDGDFLSL